jgi:WhiB family transcriptional regulator, redox-sensing transcriptional regulator
MSAEGYPGDVPGSVMPCKDEDPELFFPLQENVKGTKDLPSAEAEAAIQVCRGCLVADVCLRWAIEHGERFGIWGGMTTRQRELYARRGYRGYAA